MRGVTESTRFALRMTFLALLCVACAATATAQQSSAPGAAEKKAVRTVVERYLHGLKFNRVDSLRAAFWPDAKLYFVNRDGSLGQLSQKDWYKMFDGSEGKEEPGTLRIAAVDVTDNAASVKVVETYPKSVYVDYLNLLKLSGEWRIMNKIYTTKPR